VRRIIGKIYIIQRVYQNFDNCCIAIKVYYTEIDIILFSRFNNCIHIVIIRIIMIEYGIIQNERVLSVGNQILHCLMTRTRI